MDIQRISISLEIQRLPRILASVQRTREPTPATTPERLWWLPSWLLNHVAARANRLVAEHLRGQGVRTQYAVLAGLDDEGPISQAELARRLGIDSGDLVTIIDQLEAGGLVARTRDPADRRRNRMSITEPGATQLLALDRDVAAAQADLLAPLTADERDQFVRLLRTILLSPTPTSRATDGATQRPSGVEASESESRE